MTTAIAPDFNPGYPSKGALLGPAWQAIWDRMTVDRLAWFDGRELCAEVAKVVGAQPATVVALISRAAFAGLLDRETRPVRVPIAVKDGDGHTIGTRSGIRQRTFYRISADA